MRTHKELKMFILLTFLDARRPHSRAELLKKTWTHYTDVNEFDRIMLEFVESGTLYVTPYPHNPVFVMPSHIAEEYKKLFSKRM